MRHLDDRHWDLDTAFSVVGHWDDTLRALGGVPGVVIIGVVIAAFYYYVVYMINARHERMKKKMAAKQK